jgi:SET domain-containing protein
MALLEKQLRVRKSGLPGAGKGLFTTRFIPKNTRIVEYKGRITKWRDAAHEDNGNIYFVNRNYVIDARPYKKALARYANDAKGLTRINGMRNNAEYIEDGLKVYIKSTKDIPAGSEIFVEYGKEYWKVIRYNLRLDEKERKKKEKTRKK